MAQAPSFVSLLGLGWNFGRELREFHDSPRPVFLHADCFPFSSTQAGSRARRSRPTIFRVYLFPPLVYDNGVGSELPLSWALGWMGWGWGAHTYFTFFFLVRFLCFSVSVQKLRSTFTFVTTQYVMMQGVLNLSKVRVVVSWSQCHVRDWLRYYRDVAKIV